MELLIKNGKLIKYFPPREGDTLILPEGLASIGDHAFARSDVVNVILPGSVTGIGLGAFSDCGQLESIQLPEGLGYIGREAFSGCGSLREIIIPRRTDRLNDECFRQCASLSRVSLPVKMIFGTDVFSGCTSLERLDAEDVSIRSFALKQDTSANIERITRAIRYGTLPPIHGALRAQLAAELYFRGGCEQAKKHLRQSTMNVFQYLAKDGRTDLLLKLAAENDIVSRDIDALIEYAITAEQHEVYIMLTGLRHSTLPESITAERFRL